MKYIVLDVGIIVLLALLCVLSIYISGDIVLSLRRDIEETYGHLEIPSRSWHSSPRQSVQIRRRNALTIILALYSDETESLGQPIDILEPMF
jgi:hypothetical protein